MTEQQFKFCHKTLETPTRQASNFKTVTRFFFDFYPKIPLTTVNAQKLQCKNPLKPFIAGLLVLHTVSKNPKNVQFKEAQSNTKI